MITIQKQQTTNQQSRGILSDTIIGDNNTTSEVISETEGIHYGSSSLHDECAYSHGILNDVCT